MWNYRETSTPDASIRSCSARDYQCLRLQGHASGERMPTVKNASRWRRSMRQSPVPPASIATTRRCSLSRERIARAVARSAGIAPSLGKAGEGAAGVADRARYIVHQDRSTPFRTRHSSLIARLCCAELPRASAAGASSSTTSPLEGNRTEEHRPFNAVSVSLVRGPD